jgi:hypothetical protein
MLREALERPHRSRVPVALVVLLGIHRSYTSTPIASRPSLVRVATRASVLAVLVAVGCRSKPKSGVHPIAATSTPEAAKAEARIANCGSRAAVAVDRGRAVRPLTHAVVPGKLVVRVMAADTTAGRPSGPVRLIPATGGAEVRPVGLEAPGGVARSGPLGVGRWIVEAAGRGFETRRLTVAVRAGATDTVRFRLARACRAARS